MEGEKETSQLPKKEEEKIKETKEPTQEEKEKEHVEDIEDMKVRFETKDVVNLNLHVQVPWPKVEKELDKIYTELKKNAQIRGFRPGKAPRKILEYFFGDEVTKEVAQKIIQDSFKKITETKKIKPVSSFDFEEGKIQKETPFHFSVKLEVLPQIQFKNYTDIQINKKPINIEEKEIDVLLEKLRTDHIKYKPLKKSRSIKQGDMVIIDYKIEGQDLKSPIQEEGVSLIIGENREFIPSELSRRFVGMMPNQAGKEEYIFPQDYYQKQVRGKKVTFNFKIYEVKEPILPKLTDEFSQEIEGVSLLELRKKIRERLYVEKHRKETLRMDKIILEEVLKRNPYPIPQRLKRNLLKDFMGLLRLRFVFNSRLAEIVVLDGDLKNKTKREEEKKVDFLIRSSLALEKIAQQEEISVTDKEKEEHFQSLGKALNVSIAFLKAQSEKWGGLLDTVLLEHKILDFLRKKAKINEGV